MLDTGCYGAGVVRSTTDPAWRRYYAACSRAHLQYGEGRISLRELRRKLEAARLHALRTQAPHARKRELRRDGLRAEPPEISELADVDEAAFLYDMAELDREAGVIGPGTTTRPEGRGAG